MSRSRVLAVTLLAAVCLCSVGCFPTTMSLGPSGELGFVSQQGVFVYHPASGEVLRIHKAAPGRAPEWVQLAPDGKRAVYVLSPASDGTGASREVFVAAADGSAPRSLLKCDDQLAYTQWSPDGKTLGVLQLKQTDGGDALLQLLLVDVASGSSRVLMGRLASFFHWLPDGRSVVAVQQNARDEKTSLNTCTLVQVDVASGKATPLAAVVNESSSLDITPDGKRIYFTCRHAAAPGGTHPALADLKKAADGLFVMPLNDKTPPTFLKAASFVAVSPDGARLLLGEVTDSERPLAVRDARAQGGTVIDPKPALESNEMGSGKIWPLWVDRDHLIYFRYAVILGPEGKALDVIRVRVDGSERVNLRLPIEQAVQKAIGG